MNSQFLNAVLRHRKRAIRIKKFERSELKSNGLLTKYDVGRRAKIVAERKMLIHGLDSEVTCTPGGEVLCLHIPKPDRPFVRLLDSAQNFNQRALASSVLPNERNYLSGMNVQRNLIQGTNSAVILGDSYATNDRLAIYHGFPKHQGTMAFTTTVW